MLSKKTFHVEVRMAQSQREGQQAQKEAERPSEGNRQNPAATGTWGRDSEPAQRQTERLAEIGGERMRQATEASAAVASGTLRSGSAIASDAQEITVAWTRYAEEVMRHTSEAARRCCALALLPRCLRCRQNCCATTCSLSSIKAQE